MSKPFKMKGFPKHNTSALRQNIDISKLASMKNIDFGDGGGEGGSYTTQYQQEDITKKQEEYDKLHKRISGDPLSDPDARTIEAEGIDKGWSEKKIARKKKKATEELRKQGRGLDVSKSELAKQKAYDDLSPEEKAKADKAKEKATIEALHYLNTGRLPGEEKRRKKKNKATKNLLDTDKSIPKKDSFADLPSDEPIPLERAMPEWFDAGGNFIKDPEAHDVSFTTPTTSAQDYLMNVEARRAVQNKDPYAYRKNAAGEIEYNLNPEGNTKWDKLEKVKSHTTLEAVKNQIEGYFKTEK